MASVNWAAEAIADLAGIGEYVADFNPLAAQRLELRLRNAAEDLALFPKRGRRIGRDRRVLAVVPPYLIVYREEQGGVTILFIRHGARRPVR